MKGLRLPRLAVLGGPSFLAGVAMLVCFIVLQPMPSLRGQYVIPFLTYFTLAGAAYMIAGLRLGRDHLPLGVIWGFALLFRLVMLLTSPTLSDDVYRYIWDGHLLNQGVNPYLEAVNSPNLDFYEIQLRQQVNHGWMASPYLPAAQLLFAFVTRLAPQSESAFQLAATAFDLAAGWLVMLLLGTLGLPRRRVLLYLWNPLVVVEFAHSGHLDAWMLFLLVAAFWCLARANPAGSHQGFWNTVSAVALASATLTKIVPVLLAPLFVRRWGWRRSMAYGLIVVSACALFAREAGWGLSGPQDGTGVFGALRIYLNQWNFNGSLYHWLETSLTGYQTAGAVPLNEGTALSIQAARLLVTGALGMVTVLCGVWAWRLDESMGATHQERTLRLLRLGVLPLGAYIILATTMHPWYLIPVLPLAAFLLPAPYERSPALSRFLWPWLYLSCGFAFSYLTYLDPREFREVAFVRLVEYLPFYLLLLWASISWAVQRFRTSK